MAFAPLWCIMRSMRNLLFWARIITALPLLLLGCINQTEGYNIHNQVNMDCAAIGAPTLAATAGTLADCLPPVATAEEAVGLLQQWQRLNHEWGNVTTAKLFTEEAPALVAAYHAGLHNVIWNPQGKLAILRLSPEGWQVVFESPNPTTDAMPADGETSLAGNWSFHIAAAGDVTGDGLDDLLIQQQWSNGTHGYLSYTKLLTADGAGAEPLRILYFENSRDIFPRYTITNQTLQSTLFINADPGITRTYQFTATTFQLVGESINPVVARLSATTADGAHWYVYDSENGPMSLQQHGLYRLFEGQLSHIATPIFITVLKVLQDGHLYLAGFNETTRVVYRVEEGALINVLEHEYAPAVITTGRPTDLTLTNDGNLWVALQFYLVQLGKHESTVYDLLAHRVLAAPDGSIWALGWDGIANSQCCYFQVLDGHVTKYKFSDTLPVSAEFATQIRAMQ